MSIDKTQAVFIPSLQLFSQLLFNPFIPEFLKWALPSLNLFRTIDQNRGLSQESKQNDSVNPDKTAHNEPSYQDLHCLQKICFDLQGWNG